MESERDLLERIVFLLERQLALELYDRGVTKQDIGKILQKRKAWVVEVLGQLPKGRKS